MNAKEVLLSERKHHTDAVIAYDRALAALEGIGSTHVEKAPHIAAVRKQPSIKSKVGAEILLRERGKAIPLAEAVAVLVSRGAKMGKTDRQRLGNLRTMAGRNRGVFTLRRGEIGLREWGQAKEISQQAA